MSGTCPACGGEIPARRRTTLTFDHLAEVAEVYNGNVRTGRPSAMVQRHFRVPLRTAARWVRKAREAGLLT